MNFDKLQNWVTLIANVGVIAGIIFLAIEIGQNNELLAAQDRFNRLSVSQQPGLMLTQDPELRRILLKSASEELDPSERLAHQTFWDQVFTGWQWTYRELPFDELPIDRLRNRFRVNPATQSTWDSQKYQYDAEFVEFVETYIVED